MVNLKSKTMKNRLAKLSREKASRGKLITWEIVMKSKQHVDDQFFYVISGGKDGFSVGKAADLSRGGEKKKFCSSKAKKKNNY